MTSIDVYGRTITVVVNADGSSTGTGSDGTSMTVPARRNVLGWFNTNPPAGWVIPGPLPPTQNDIATAIDAMLDALAQSWGYDDKTSIATYLTSAVPVFKDQAVAFCAYRDAVWSQAYLDLAALAAGTKSLPVTVGAYITALPAPPAMPTT